MAEKIYEMPERLRAALLEYLMQRPYKEVAAGVEALQYLKEIIRRDEVYQSATAGASKPHHE